MKHNHKLFLDFAIRIAEESSAVRLKAGAFIAKNAVDISSGYNGTPSDWETNICEIPSKDDPDRLMTNEDVVIHAEMNALLKAARTGRPTEGATMYCSHAPCARCAKHIVQAGIVEVHFAYVYRLTDGLDILKKAGIHCVHHEDHEFLIPAGTHSVSR